MCSYAITLWALAAAIMFLSMTNAWDAQPDGYEVIDGPSPHEDLEQWRTSWKNWKTMELRSVRYGPSNACNIYNIPIAQWTQSNFVQAFVMLHDRQIFDRATNKYTPDKYIATMEQRVGKLDSVLLWPAYPNSGIDSRNQWDMLRTLPGGLNVLQRLITVFHNHNIRVILPYNPWDTATRDEDGLGSTVRMYSADIITMNAILPHLHADGFNGDTMYGVPKSFYQCSNPLIATPEGGVPSSYLSHNPMSWGYFSGYSNFPPVARAKFLESRHMVQLCARWSLDRVTELQTAFFNGVGYVVWENVWGIWNAMTERESEATKRVFHVLRKFAAFTTSSDWKPYVYRSNDGHVSASLFPASKQSALYTIINTSPDTGVLELPLEHGSVVVYDVYHGRQLSLQANQSTVEITIEARGFGALLVTSADHEIADFGRYMEERQTMTQTPLSAYSTRRVLLQQTMTKLPSSTSINELDDPSPIRVGMRHVKGMRGWWFNVTGVQVEPVHEWTPNWSSFGSGVQFPWEQRPSNNHSVRLDIRDFYIDRFPVTNAQFHEFLHLSKYEPNTRERFLEHWENRGDEIHGWHPLTEWKIPENLENSPVVFVSVEDARAYAAFYKKRLPHDWEWQYVAGNGASYDVYPWGSAHLDASKVHPISREKSPEPVHTSVGSFPRSRAIASGVEDLVGFVWQMTDTFCDDHTCGVLLRGGSYYQPVASTFADPNWYFPQAYQSNQHNRFLMLSESYDRSAFVGFRCAKSVE